MKKILMLLVLPVIIYAQASINITGMGVELNNYGRLRVFNQNTVGLQYYDHISILVASSPSTVFDYFEDSGKLDTARKLFPSPIADTGIYVSYNNSFSNLPPKITVKQNLYAWNNAPYFLTKYAVYSNDSTSFAATTGMEIVPQIGGYFGSDSMSYNFDKHYFKVFKGDKITAFKYFNQNGSQITSLKAFNWYPLYQKDTTYFKMLTQNISDTTWFSNDQGAIVISGHAPVTLNLNDSIVFYYAFTMGNNDSVISANLDAAALKFNRIITGVEEQFAVVPSEFLLEQNYPNPFNPATTISFSIPYSSHIKLNIYNILGELVSTLMDGVKSAGYYKVNFNASSLPSGVYIYRLEGEGTAVSRKMMLLK